MINQDIQHSLSLLRELYKKDQQWLAEQRKTEIYTANRFNPFRFLRKDEIGLSAILAFFLNPEEEHGQGEVFINSFLERLNLHHFLSYDKVDVSVEKIVRNQRRHDIFIQGYLKGKIQWVFSIENKLNWAVEQPEQLKDYLTDLNAYGVNNYFLMFLPVESSEPESIEKDEWQQEVNSGHAIVWDTKSIVEWLENVVIIAPEIKSFVKFFILYLKEYVMGENRNSSNLANAIVNDVQMIKVSVDILNSKNEILSLLIDKLAGDLKSKFCMLDRFSEWEHRTYEDFGTQYFNLIEFVHKSQSEQPEFSICLHFSSNNFQDMKYGIAYWNNIVSNKKKIKMYEELFEPLYPEFKGGKNKYWFYWEWFTDKDLRNWNSETWAKIPSGQLADEIWKEIEPLCKAVTQLDYPQD